MHAVSDAIPSLRSRSPTRRTCRRHGCTPRRCNNGATVILRRSPLSRCAAGYSQCRFELEPNGGAVKLTITHSMERADSVFVEKVSGGWPSILSNLKSLLETGEVAIQAPG